MRTHFDDAIGAVPPPTVDMERVIARGRRRERLRRWGTGGAAVVAVGVLGATLLVTAGASERSEDVAGPPGPAPSPSAARTPAGGASPSASAAPKPTRHTPPAEAQATEARLTQALQAAVTRVAPGFTAGKSFDGHDPFRFGYLYHENDASGGDFNHYNAFANLTGNGRSGELVVSLGQVSTVWQVPTDCSAGGEPGCKASVGPNGELIMGQRIESESATTHYVAVTRPDGTAILITAANQGGQTDNGAPRQTEPVLTVEQLVAIATDPALHI